MIRELFIAILFCTATPMAVAATCSVDIESNDAMRYNLGNIDVSRSCSEFTITLKHVGKLPKAAMGHNIVVARTADVAAIASDGIKAGLDSNYIKPGDTRVIAHSSMVGGGESVSIRLPVAEMVNGPYSYFCSFPGHWALMKGTITLTP